MKNYTLKEEGVWKELISVVPTEEEFIILAGPDSEEKNNLIASIEERSLLTVPEEVTELLNLKYTEAKGKLKNVTATNYKLFACYISITENQETLGKLSAIVDNSHVEEFIK